MQTIVTKYHGPSNTRGSYMSAKTQSGSIRVGYDHGLNVGENHRAAAEAMRVKMKWTKPTHSEMVGGNNPDGTVSWVFVSTRDRDAELVTQNPRNRGFYTAGTRIRIRAHKSEPGKGLSYPDKMGVLAEDAHGGGWDVYDLADGSSIYGFSIVRKAKQMETVRTKNPRNRDVFKIGDRVEIDPSLLNYTRGARFGRVVGLALTANDKVRVKFPEHGDEIFGGPEESFAKLDKYMRSRFDSKPKRRRIKKNPAPILGFAIFAQHNGPKMHFDGKAFTDSGRAKRFVTQTEARNVATTMLAKFSVLKKYRITVEASQFPKRGAASSGR